MTLIIGKYSPVNIVRMNDVLRSQYIIPTNDIDSFLSALNVDTLLNLMEEQDGSN